MMPATRPRLSSTATADARSPCASCCLETNESDCSHAINRKSSGQLLRGQQTIYSLCGLHVRSLEFRRSVMITQPGVSGPGDFVAPGTGALCDTRRTGCMVRPFFESASASRSSSLLPAQTIRNTSLHHGLGAVANSTLKTSRSFSPAAGYLDSLRTQEKWPGATVPCVDLVRPVCPVFCAER